MLSFLETNLAPSGQERSMPPAGENHRKAGKKMARSEETEDLVRKNSQLGTDFCPKKRDTAKIRRFSAGFSGNQETKEQRIGVRVDVCNVRN